MIYFDLRGRAEPIRLSFEELGEAYDEDRVSPERWKTMKAETPFAALPILEDGGLRFPQTLAIYQHIARTRDLYGKGENEHVAVDVLVTLIDQVIGVIWGQFWRPDCDATLAEFENGMLRDVLRALERWYLRDSRDAQFWAGNGITFADCFAFRFLDEIDAFFPQSLARFAPLAQFHASFKARPRIAAYIRSGRRPPAFGVALNGPKFDMRSHQ